MYNSRFKVGDLVWFDPSKDSLCKARDGSEPVKIKVMAIAQNKDYEYKFSYAVDVSDICGYEDFDKVTEHEISLWRRSISENIVYMDDVEGKTIRWLDANQIIDLAEHSVAKLVSNDKGGFKYI